MLTVIKCNRNRKVHLLQIYLHSLMAGFLKPCPLCHDIMFDISSVSNDFQCKTPGPAVCNKLQGTDLQVQQREGCLELLVPISFSSGSTQ